MSDSDKAQPAIGRTVAFRGGGFAPTSYRWIGVAVFIALIGIAEWGTRSGWISALTLPKPSDVLQTFRELFDSGLLFKHLLPSLTRLIVGAAIGVSIGISVGILIGLFSYIPDSKNCITPLICHMVWDWRRFKICSHCIRHIYTHCCRYLRCCGQRRS